MEEFNITIEELRGFVNMSLLDISDDLPEHSWFFRQGYNAALGIILERIKEEEA